MTGSSPATRRSRQWSSPSRSRIAEFLAENRHTELSHQDALAAAQAEHERVRHAAIRVFEDHELKEEHRRLQEREEIIIQQQRREEERICNEERVRAEEERLRALKLKTVPKPPPEAPAASSSNSTSRPQLNGSASSGSIAATNSAYKLGTILLQGNESSVASPQSLNAPVLPVNGTKVAQPAQAQSLPQGQHVASTKPSPSATPSVISSFPRPPTSQQNSLSTVPTSKPPVDRYVVIHQNLKKLRASLAEQAKSSPPLKARMGDMRRELRKSLGQMVAEKGANKKQVGNDLHMPTI